MSGDIPMPPNTRILEHQVAGHFHARSKSLLGALQDNKSGIILKPLQASPNSPKELGFYTNLFNKSNTNKYDIMLRRLVPNFFGIFQYNELQYIRLENICIPFRFPCVADIKIGRRTFGPDSTLAKRIREVSKCPLAFQVGFQTAGMKVYQQSTRQYTYHDRLCCRSLLHNEIIYGLAWFFTPSCGSISSKSKLCIKNVLDKLYIIRDFFVEQRIYNMYGVSVLIVYEGCFNTDYFSKINKTIDTEKVQPIKSTWSSTLTSSSVDNDDCSTETLYCCEPLSSIDHLSSETDKTSKDENCKYSQSSSTLEEITQDFNKSFDTTSNCSQNRCNKPIVDVRLIDFVHVYPNENPDIPDENFLYGLHSLINYLETLLKPGFVCRKLPQFSSCLIDDVTTCCVTDVN